MHKKHVVLALVLVSAALLQVVNVECAKAEDQTIYIRADGSIDPSTAPMQRSGSLYTLTLDTVITLQYDGIVIERSDLTLDGAVFIVDGVRNVTIRNVRITEFTYGIALQCLNCTVCGSYLWRNKLSGIFLSGASCNTIFENTMAENGEGLGFCYSSNNVIFENNIIGSKWRGVYTEESNHNRFYSNNFLNDTYHVFDHSMLNPYYIRSSNVWDDGHARGGNYWDDYNGSDLNHDGIGDTPQYLYTDNTDRYPLTTPHDLSIQYYSFCAGTWNGTSFHVSVAGKTTLSNFTFNADQKLAHFDISTSYSATGFCRIAIPNALLGGSYELWADTASTYFSSATNGTHAFLYFNYSHDAHTIRMVVTTAIPEFNSLIIDLSLAASTLLGAILFESALCRPTHDRLSRT